MSSLPPIRSRHRVCVICEGYEDYHYFKRLIDLNVWDSTYSFTQRSCRNINCPDRVCILRAMTETVRNDIHQSLEQLAKVTAKAYGCEAVFEYERGPAPVINDAGVCDRAAVVARELGLIVETNPPSMITEDFSRYLKLAPGALFLIGTGGGFDNHHPSFTADPSALLTTARFFAILTERELKRLSMQVYRYSDE